MSQPHDKFFRTVFSDAEEAALFLREHLLFLRRVGSSGPHCG
ncbi:hypothetical protein CLDAP_40430 [Caldilinea aerophila DSM 14535 = NBRC 104270]|uniref:Transposase (putative) YhgA-like domain-containing protein n=1 Tax=Caldilinea aerophila (strain DSM 14535 / JCM 11387 / NBRC 104270 / STL-6-O1) TaxID=926550 RepID=I0I9Z5_CALAS|nr:hypothetical protein CLDAP_40430 [Caldilinea aerophila DSM 14535 = NBRC 104270]